MTLLRTLPNPKRSVSLPSWSCRLLIPRLSAIYPRRKSLAGQAAAAYETLSKNIIKAARAKAAAEKIKDNEKLLLDLEIEREELEQTISDNSEALEKAIGKRKAIIRKISAKDKLSLSGPSAKEHRLLAETGAAVQNLMITSMPLPNALRLSSCRPGN